MFPPLALVLGWLLRAPRDANAGAAHAGRSSPRDARWRWSLVVGYDRFAPRFADERVPAELLIAFGAVGARRRSRRRRGRRHRRAASRFARRRLAEGALRGHRRAVADALWPGCSSRSSAFDALSPMRSASAILRGLRSKRRPFDRDAPFYQVGMYDQTVPVLPRPHDDARRLPRRAGARPRRRAAEAGADARRQWIAEWQALPQGYALMEPRRARAAGRARRADARARARSAPRVVREPRDDARRVRVPDDRRAAQRRRAAAAQGRHQRARRHHAHPRQLARHAAARWRRRATSSLGIACYALSPRSSGSSGCRACRCRSPTRCCRSATSSTRSPRTTCSAKRSRVTRWLGIGFIVVGVWLVARS